LDLDLCLGDADVFLDTIPEYTLSDVAQNINRLDLTKVAPLPNNGGVDLYETLDRNLAKSNSRMIETCNAWEPGAGSVAFSFVFLLQGVGVSQILRLRKRAARRESERLVVSRVSTVHVPV
jgi:hypothetical protein